MGRESMEMNLTGGLHNQIQQASVVLEAESNYQETAATENAASVQSVIIYTRPSPIIQVKKTTGPDKYYADQFKVYKTGQLLYINSLDTDPAHGQLAVTIANVQKVAYADTERNAATYPSINNEFT